MLATLRIKNLALVTDLTLELQPGYNVITGETGAGKSIIIEVASIRVPIRCVAIDKQSVKVEFLGVTEVVMLAR